jgi:hypothetical protein
MRLSVTHTLGLCPKPRTRREAGLGMIHPSPAPASSVLGLQGVKRLSRHKRERKNLSRIYSTVLLTPFQPFLPALSQMSQKPRKKAYKGLGFPIARLGAVISLGSGAVIGHTVVACEGKGTGEQTLLRGLLPLLQPGDILLADALLATWWVIAEARAAGVSPEA